MIYMCEAKLFMTNEKILFIYLFIYLFIFFTKPECVSGGQQCKECPHTEIQHRHSCGL